MSFPWPLELFLCPGMNQILKLLILSADYTTQFVVWVSKVFLVWNVASWLKVLILRDLEQTGIFPYEDSWASSTVVRCGTVAMWLPRAKPQECVIVWTIPIAEKVKEAFHWSQLVLDFQIHPSPQVMAAFIPLNSFLVRCLLGGGDPQLPHLS